MALKYKSNARYLKADPKFSSKLVEKFVNALMWDGKKSVAQNLFYKAMGEVEKRNPDRSALEVFEQAINNLKPQVEVRSKRVGGSTYQVPIEVKRDRQQALAFRWLLQVCRSKKGTPMYKKLANEILDAYRKEGAAYTIRENVHRMAESNKAFSHFA